MFVWIQISRLRTLLLAFSSISMGGFLAAWHRAFSWSTFFLCCLTAVLLQVLSNVANDYGDSIHGADHDKRQGPMRATQKGLVSLAQMRKAIIICVLFILFSGLALLWKSLGISLASAVFVLLGFLCIAGALLYTLGSKPYGYVGLGDLSVVIFFGLVGVMGSVFLFTHELKWVYVYPALSCGLLATTVMNINNIRDIQSDKLAGKKSLPVRFGKRWAVVYHWFLIGGAWLMMVVFSMMHFTYWFQFGYVIMIPFFIQNGIAVSTKPTNLLDKWLFQMSISIFIVIILFGLGMIIG